MYGRQYGIGKLEDSEEANTVQHCSTRQTISTRQTMIWEWQCSDDIVCLSDDDGLNDIDTLLKSTYRAKDTGALVFGDSDVKSLQLLNRVFRVGTSQT